MYYIFSRCQLSLYNYISSMYNHDSLFSPKHCLEAMKRAVHIYIHTPGFITTLFHDSSIWDIVGF